MDTQTAAEIIPGAVAAAGGAGGVAWFTRMMIGRMIKEYDKRIAQHARKMEALFDRLAEQGTKIAVLETVLEDARRLRIDLEQRVATLRGEQETRIQTLLDELNDMRRDVYVAHERLRALAAGDQEISKIQAPPVVRRR